MNASKKKVLFLTGTRADFGKLKPLIEQVKRASDEFEYGIFATGMHMLSRYGSTANEIRKAGFDNIFPYINQDGAIDSQMDLVLANTIQGLGHYIREHFPDLLIVHGDRVETLAGAIVGALKNVLVGHVEGGEVSGTVDGLIRHAVTKLSHLHFVSNEEARGRLIQMGEAPHTIYVVGSPDIDVMLSDSLPDLEEVKLKYEVNFSRYGIAIYHPVTTELHLLKEHIEAVVDALEQSGLNFVVIHPNNDTGVQIVLDALHRLENNSRFRLIPSMRFEYFLTLLKNAFAIVGNSSAGVREAHVYGIPTVNIGTRQMNRFTSSSIRNVPEDTQEIQHALKNLPRSLGRSLHFGKGNSAALFMAALRNPALWTTDRQKHFHDLSPTDASELKIAPPAPSPVSL